MEQFKNRLIFSLIIPVLLLNLYTDALFGAAHELEESGISIAHEIFIFNDFTEGHCAECPDGDHQHSEDSHSSWDQQSTLYFGRQAPLISYHPNITAHVTSEPFRAIPEVYLDKFIPPHNLA